MAGISECCPADTKHDDHEVEVLQEKVSQLEYELSHYKTSNEDLISQLAKSNRQVKKLNSYNDELRTQVESLSKDLHDYRKKKPDSCEGQPIQLKSDVGVQVNADDFEIVFESKALPDWNNTCQKTEEYSVDTTCIADSLKATAEAILNQQNPTTSQQADSTTTNSSSNYVYDENYQMYYDYNSGYYLDTNNNLYYDPKTGTYFYYNHTTQNYEFHSQVDVNLPSTQHDATDHCEQDKQDRKHHVRHTPKKKKESKHKKRSRSRSRSESSSRDPKKSRKKSKKSKHKHSRTESTEKETMRTSSRSRRGKAVTCDLVKNSDVSKEVDNKSDQLPTSVDEDDNINLDGQCDDVSVRTDSEFNPQKLNSTQIKPSKQNSVNIHPKDKVPKNKKAAKITQQDDVDSVDSPMESVDSPVDETKTDILGPTINEEKMIISDEESNSICSGESELESGELSVVTSDSESDSPDDEPPDDELDNVVENADANVNDTEVLKDAEAEANVNDTEVSKEILSQFVPYSSEDKGLQEANEASVSWPPCIRVIVEESECLSIGDLFIITCTGGSIGREKAKDHLILINDVNISRTHCKVSFNYDINQYVLNDEGSQHGTFINDIRLSEAHVKSSETGLNHGDVLKLGTTKLLLHIHPGSDTCLNCEPGEVKAKLKQDSKKDYVHLTSEQKKKLRKEELNSIKKRYGLKNMAYEDNTKAINNPLYEDKAAVRRKKVGSDCQDQKSEAPASVHRPISESNKGHKLLAKMGWKEGDGLGKSSSGIVDPINVTYRANQTAGFGSTAASAQSIDNVDGSSAKKASIWKQTQQRFQKLEGLPQLDIFADQADDESPDNV